MQYLLTPQEYHDLKNRADAEDPQMRIESIARFFLAVSKAFKAELIHSSSPTRESFIAAVQALVSDLHLSADALNKALASQRPTPQTPEPNTHQDKV